MVSKLSKPPKPAQLSEEFGGTKSPFNSDKIQNGYLEGVPDILSGDNLNYLLDNLGKNQKYSTQLLEFINNLPPHKFISVDENNELVYVDRVDSSQILPEQDVETVGKVLRSTNHGAMWENETIQPQSLYQERIVLNSPIITLQDKVCRYEKTVVAGDNFSISKSGVYHQKDMTFELILKMPTSVSFSLEQIVPLESGETADNNKKWMGGSVPDLSQAGEHWIAFTSHDYGVTWRASYEGYFLL